MTKICTKCNLFESNFIKLQAAYWNRNRTRTERERFVSHLSRKYATNTKVRVLPFGFTRCFPCPWRSQLSQGPWSWFRFITYLYFERVAHLDALHSLRTEHVVRDQLHLRQEREADHLLNTRKADQCNISRSCVLLPLLKRGHSISQGLFCSLNRAKKYHG